MRFFSLLAALDSDLNLLSVMVDPLILFRLTPLTFITNLLPLDLALPFPCSALPLLLCPSLCLCFNFLFHIKTLKHFHKKRAVTWAIKNQKHSWEKKRVGGDPWKCKCAGAEWWKYNTIHFAGVDFMFKLYYHWSPLDGIHILIALTLGCILPYTTTWVN